MHELDEPRVGPGVPDDARRDVQVVVMEEDRRVRVAVELVDHRGRECAVHLQVPLAPRMVDAVVDTRRRRELPQMMLHEPEHRVRDHVVEPVIRLLVVHDQPKAERRAPPSSLLEGLAVVVESDNAILLRHRTRDPGHVVMHDKAAKRGDETAAAAPCNSLTVAAAIGDRPSVRDDDEVPARRHHGTLTPGRET